ncbi:hypothetical protein PO909_022629 [Leuciscus waleckii]
MPLRKRDTARAISLMEDYCSKLKKPEEQQLKTAILRVTGIFKSSLFQALIVAHWNPLDTEPLLPNRETNHSLPICSIEVFNGPYLSLSSEQGWTLLS